MKILCGTIALLIAGAFSAQALDGQNVWAADIIHHGNYFYLFVNHGSCCQGTNSTCHILVGRSEKITGPYLDKEGNYLARGAGTLFLAAEGNNIGPGHFGLLLDDGVEKFSCHYEGIVGRAGRSVLDIRPLFWTPDGWPVAGRNLRGGTHQIRSQRTSAVLQGSTNVVETARYLARVHQQWIISPEEHGFYKILNAHSGGALTAAGSRIEINPFVGTDERCWKMDQLSDGSYRVAARSNRSVLAATFKTAPGNGVALEPFTGSAAQRWEIVEP